MKITKTLSEGGGNREYRPANYQVGLAAVEQQDIVG